MNNHSKYIQLRNKYDVFTYQKFDIEEHTDYLKVNYFFNIDRKHFFSPSITFHQTPASYSCPIAGKHVFSCGIGGNDKLLENLLSENYQY